MSLAMVPPMRMIDAVQKDLCDYHSCRTLPKYPQLAMQIHELRL